MSKRKMKARVVSQTWLAEGICSMWLEAPEIAGEAVPGQFISVYPNDRTKLLPRPFGICETDPAGERLRIVYQVMGKGTGTEEFSRCRAGDTLEILGPLGNGFPLKGERALLIGGGIGSVPLLFLARKLSCGKTAVLGYRDSRLYLKEDFESCAKVAVATEDGSAGTKGNVLDAIREQKLSGDVIYACGPTPMLKAVKQYAMEQGIECYLSLDERMACGIGACLACVCHTRDVDGHSHVKNARICKDGPVFRAEAVELLSAAEQRERIAGGQMCGCVEKEKAESGSCAAGKPVEPEGSGRETGKPVEPEGSGCEAGKSAEPESSGRETGKPVEPESSARGKEGRA